MTKTEKIKALIAYEIKWACDQEAFNEVDNVADYIVALFELYSDKEIDRQYRVKFED